MIEKGKVLRFDSGKRIRVNEVIKPGGQGIAYNAMDESTGRMGVVKIFHDRFNTADTRARLKYLISQDLKSICSVIEPPTDSIITDSLVGHYTRYVGENSLEEYLTNPQFSFSEGIQLAIALAHTIEKMHDIGIAHGDLQAENLRISKQGSTLRLHVIDLDNYSKRGMPLPPCVGQNLYMAPELRASGGTAVRSYPCIETDLFSLGVLMHEIILLKHVSAGNDANETDFHKAMCSGMWLMDPASDNRPSGNLGGYPIEVLNADLARLFRASMSIDPAKRPRAGKWKSELDKAFNSVFCCPRPKCGGPCIIDVSKVICPICKKPYPKLNLEVKNRRTTLTVATGSTIIGRADLGGSRKVSVRHAFLRRIGPETWLESVGSNGTYRWSGASWKRLPDRTPVLIQGKDLLRFGDVEVLVGCEV